MYKKQNRQRSFEQWAATTCTAPRNVIAGQYATSNCKTAAGQNFPVSGGI